MFFMNWSNEMNKVLWAQGVMCLNVQNINNNTLEIIFMTWLKKYIIFYELFALILDLQYNNEINDNM